MAGLVSAPVAIVEYSDFECPSCAQFAREVEPHLRKEYIDKGKVVLVYKHFPLSIHPMAGAAARAAWCAARQGKPWEMHDRLFRIRKGLQDSDLVSAAQEIGLDITVYNSCRVGGEAAKQVEMDRAEGDAIIVMDADLQDPPEVVLDMIAKWREGYEIVYAKRLSREGESFLKLATARMFYRLLRKLSSVDIPENVGDFRLIDRRVLEAFKAMPERDRFVRGMFSWLGFRQTAVEFHREARTAGVTKYGWSKMFRLATDGVIGFSDGPLRAALWLGAGVSSLALVFGAYVIALSIFGSGLVPGWASLAVLTSLFAGMNLLTVGVIGIYVGRIHNEVKQRPLYVVGREEGFKLARSMPAGQNRRAG